MSSRAFERYRVFRLDAEPGIGWMIPESDPVPECLTGPGWSPAGEALLPRVPDPWPGCAGRAPAPGEAGKETDASGRRSVRAARP